MKTLTLTLELTVEEAGAVADWELPNDSAFAESRALSKLGSAARVAMAIERVAMRSNDHTVTHAEVSALSPWKGER